MNNIQIIMTIYGWYSEEAFITNKIGYIYTDKNNIYKLCTMVSGNNICPYYQHRNIYKETFKFVGELHILICPIHCHGDTRKRKIENSLNELNTKEILNKSMTNREERLKKLIY